MKYKKTVILLAGGKGSRLNYIDKNFLLHNDKSFFEITLKKIQNFSEIIVVSNSTQKYSNYNVKVIEDEIKDIGPMGGILTGLKASSFDECLILSCDMPFLRKDFLDYLGLMNGEYDLAIPKHSFNREPLCGLYKKSCLEVVQKSIDDNIFKIGNIFNSLNLKWIDINKLNSSDLITKSFFNVNTFDDLDILNKKTKIG